MGRESLAKSTMAKTLAWDECTTMPVDKVVAIGLAARHNEAGSLLLRVDALDDGALHKVMLLVVRKLNHDHRIARGFGQRIAVAVLHEHLRPGCFNCGGTGEVVADQTVVPCGTCGGTGLQRYTDADRANLIGGAYNKKAYADALQYVRDALVRIVGGANNRLTD